MCRMHWTRCWHLMRGMGILTNFFRRFSLLPRLRIIRMLSRSLVYKPLEFTSQHYAGTILSRLLFTTGFALASFLLLMCHFECKHHVNCDKIRAKLSYYDGCMMKHYSIYNVRGQYGFKTGYSVDKMHWCAIETFYMSKF